MFLLSQKVLATWNKYLENTAACVNILDSWVLFCIPSQSYFYSLKLTQSFCTFENYCFNLEVYCETKPSLC